MTPEMKFEVRNEVVEKLLTDIGRLIKSKMPPGYGFSLMIFSYGAGGDLFYVSSGEREDMIRIMQEFIEKFREN